MKNNYCKKHRDAILCLLHILKFRNLTNPLHMLLLRAGAGVAAVRIIGATAASFPYHMGRAKL